jgi:Kef-type K+ transport system membrane component KefB
VVPFGIGFAVAYLFGGTMFQSLFVGMGISITAIAVQAVVLQSMHINRSQLGHIIIGAAIVDDILSLMGLSVLLSLARQGSFDAVQLLILIGKVGAFFALTVVLAVYILPPLTRRLTDEAGKAFTFAIAVGLGMAQLADLAGLHHIIGAFVAGQFVRREIVKDEIYKVIASRFFGISYGFLVPIFFVSLSFHLELVASWSFVSFALVITAAAVIGKVVGSGIPLRLFGHSNWESMVVGFGMNGRGAVELVVASVVLGVSKELMEAGEIGSPLLTSEQFSALVLMAFVTTLLAPITLKWSVLKTCRHDEGVDFCTILDTSSGH